MNTEQKTPIEWFQMLKEPYRSEAINNLSKKMSCYIEFPDSLIQALNCSFAFADSNEGNNYWWEILRSIKAGETTYLETELKPQDIENKRIPFDWEKYQSGEFEITCRNGDKPEQITHNPKAQPFPIGAWIDVRMCTFDNKGKYGIFNNEHDYDLFLIPKPKKFQAWVNLYSNGDVQSYLSKELANHMNEIHTNRGLVLIECRLIEWEG
jgi:hypothetical protein